MNSLPLLLLALASLTIESKLIELPFSTVRGHQNVIETTIGTPGQQIYTRFNKDPFYLGLQLAGRILGDDGFDRNASTTFVQTDIHKDYQGKPDGVIGNDTVQVGGVALPNKPLSVLDRDWDDATFGTLSLSHTDNGDSFIEVVLKEQEEQIVVLSYDSVPLDYTANYSGSLFLGGKPDICSNWTLVPEVVYQMLPFQLWAVELKKIKAGKFTSILPGQALISFDEPYFSLPQGAYSSILDGLGAITYDQVPCDSTTDLVFVIGDFEVRFTPDDYLDKSDESSGNCYFLGDEVFGSDNFILPSTIFRNRCILLDYANKQIGFSNKNK